MPFLLLRTHPPIAFRFVQQLALVWLHLLNCTCVFYLLLFVFTFTELYIEIPCIFLFLLLLFFFLSVQSVSPPTHTLLIKCGKAPLCAPCTPSDSPDESDECTDASNEMSDSKNNSRKSHLVFTGVTVFIKKKKEKKIPIEPPAGGTLWGVIMISQLYHVILQTEAAAAAALRFDSRWG